MIRPIVAVVALMLLAGTVLTAELGARALIRSGRLPVAPSSDPEADVSLANITRIGRPDVLVLGTSAIRSALRPNVLQELILASTGQRLRVQTVAQPALSLEGHRILVRGLGEQGLIPGVVILGLTPSTMTGYGAAGDWFPESEIGRLWGGCGRQERSAAISCALGRWSALWRWRNDGGAVRAALEQDEMPRSVGGPERRLTPSGWLSERPVRTYTLEERIPRLLAVLPEGVPLPQENVDSFVALIEELRGYGATVVAVALPYAPPLEAALIARHPAWRAERHAGYSALSEAAGLPIVELEAFGDWWEPRSQNDLRHISRRGAGPLTRQLWDEPGFREPILDALGFPPLEAAEAASAP